MSGTGQRVERILWESAGAPERPPRQRLRVAAYCRVSTKLEEQQTSFEGQVRAYTDMIEARSDWMLAGVYADPGATGTSAQKRPAFLRMIHDAEDGRLDLIVTKSISRFARNTVECLSYVRHLNELGVHIWFENNHIDTRTAFSEMLLAVLAAFAQEESHSISENIKWGIRKRYEAGTARWCRLYGYQKAEDGGCAVQPQEAAVVRRIFDWYEHGASIQQIVCRLAEEGVPSKTGHARWTPSSVHTLLKNERYTGDILLQKFITTDHITHRAVVNDCTRVPAYYIENHHPPIVARKTFERVQRIRRMRRLDPARGGCGQYPFGETLRCSRCGQPLTQRIQAHKCVWGCDACRGVYVEARAAQAAAVAAYAAVDMAVLAQKTSLSLQEARLLEWKRAHPVWKTAEYFWLDELVLRLEAASAGTLTVYWRAGLVTTAPLKTAEKEAAHGESDTDSL